MLLISMIAVRAKKTDENKNGRVPHQRVLYSAVFICKPISGNKGVFLVKM